MLLFWHARVLTGACANNLAHHRFRPRRRQGEAPHGRAVMKVLPRRAGAIRQAALHAPVDRPEGLQPRRRRCAPVAQLDRASDYESEGQRFESFRARQSFQEFSAIASKPTRGAESCSRLDELQDHIRTVKTTPLQRQAARRMRSSACNKAQMLTGSVSP